MPLSIQRLCGIFRYLILTTGAAFLIYIVLALLVVDTWDLNISYHQYDELRQDEGTSQFWLVVVAVPDIIIAFLFYYWLQALFGAYQKGEFFAEYSMRCYLWLVWLKMSDFLYELLTPALLSLVPGVPEETGMHFNIDIGEFFTLALLLVILYVLRNAQQIEAENKEFV